LTGHRKLGVILFARVGDLYGALGRAKWASIRATHLSAADICRRRWLTGDLEPQLPLHTWFVWSGAFATHQSRGPWNEGVGTLKTGWISGKVGSAALLARVSMLASFRCGRMTILPVPPTKVTQAHHCIARLLYRPESLSSKT
jgi:hypothetical protein